MIQEEVWAGVIPCELRVPETGGTGCLSMSPCCKGATRWVSSGKAEPGCKELYKTVTDMP